MEALQYSPGTISSPVTKRSAQLSSALTAVKFEAFKQLRASQRKALSTRSHTPVVAATKVSEVRGSVLAATGLRFAIVAARFNDIVTKPLVSGALETFKTYAVKDEHVDVIWVPGSFEIPLVAQELGKSGKYDAVVCIGAVVRGATSHYDAVANSAASGIMSASLHSGVPCVFGVLTCDSMEQAFDRAGGKVGNKGGESALVAIEMASLFKHTLKVQTGASH